MSLLAELIRQLNAPHEHKGDGAERQAKHLAKRIECEGIDAVRQQWRDSYYRRRDAILARRKAKRLER